MSSPLGPSWHQHSRPRATDSKKSLAERCRLSGTARVCAGPNIGRRRKEGFRGLSTELTALVPYPPLPIIVFSRCAEQSVTRGRVGVRRSVTASGEEELPLLASSSSSEVEVRSTTAPELHNPIHSKKHYTEKPPRPVESEPKPPGVRSWLPGKYREPTDRVTSIVCVVHRVSRVVLVSGPTLAVT